MIKDDATASHLAAIAYEAGGVIMRHYRDGAAPRLKEDWTPVTDADEEAEALILKALARDFPGVPVAAEEEVAAGGGCNPCEHFFLVEPLAGAGGFLKRK